MSNLRYGDDTTLLATSAQDLEDLLEKVRRESERFGLFLNVSKTKMMVINQAEENPTIHAGGEEVEIVKQFNYLGAMITTEGGVQRKSDAESEWQKQLCLQ